MARQSERDLLFIEKLSRLPKILCFSVMLLFICGLLALYSAAKGNFQPWAIRQIASFIVALPLVFTIILADIRFWYRNSYVMYFFGLALLLLVEIMGDLGVYGAQRWLEIGSFRFQPSELVKVFLVAALARYFHAIHMNNLHRFTSLIIPALLIGGYAGLILIQPNLGTAAITCMVSGIIIFITGISWKKIIFATILVVGALPLLWANMHDYQKRRVDTFLNPEKDPLGAGYNIIQSKIAIGSGGVSGKGFLKGSQSQLNFVPEQQTDFIFSIVAEEFGFFGSLFIIITNLIIFICCLVIALESHSYYGKVIAGGMSAILFVHLFVNVGMVSGLLPVVGVPLPFISYGGSSLISSFLAMAFVANVAVHRDINILLTEEDDDI